VSKSVEDQGKPEMWSRTLCRKRTTYGHDLTPEIFLSIHNLQVRDEAHPSKKKNSFRSSLWLLATYQLEVAKG